MSKLTPFGLEVRTQRLNKGIRLNEMANTIKVTSSFVSGIEVGRRPIPKDYVEKVAKALSANPEECQRLVHTADQTRNTVNLEQVQSSKGKALVNALARKVDHLTPEQQEDIEKIINSILSSLDNEAPFKRKRGHIVNPQGYHAIWNRSEEFHKYLPKLPNGWLDIQAALERIHIDYKDWTFDIVKTQKLGNEEGRTDFTHKVIILREDVWDKLVNHDYRARFTACHEYGHFVLHSNQNIVMRRSKQDDYPIYQDAEWQADVFAGSLLMPASQLQNLIKEQPVQAACSIENNFGISTTAAHCTWEQYSKRKGIISQEMLLNNNLLYIKSFSLNQLHSAPTLNSN